MPKLSTSVHHQRLRRAMHGTGCGRGTRGRHGCIGRTSSYRSGPHESGRRLMLRQPRSCARGTVSRRQLYYIRRFLFFTSKDISSHHFTRNHCASEIRNCIADCGYRWHDTTNAASLVGDGADMVAAITVSTWRTIHRRLRRRLRCNFTEHLLVWGLTAHGPRPSYWKLICGTL